MTLSEIVAMVGPAVGIVIGYSSKYIGGLLTQKKNDTIRDYEIARIKERQSEMQKDIDEMTGKVNRIPVIEEQIKQLFNGQDKH